MDINVTSNIKEVIANVDNFVKKQITFVVAKTLTKTAKDVKDEEVKQLPRYIDRPTPYTVNSIYVKPATKTNLTSEVGFKDYAGGGTNKRGASTMLPQVEGGRRSVKGFENALRRIGVLPQGMFIAPGEACPLDAYGNIPPSLIIQIMSYFRAFGEQGYKANITDKRKAKLKKGSKKTGFGFEYIVSYGPGTNSGRQHLPAGIYKKTYFLAGKGTKAGAIKPIMMFVKAPSYRARFPFFDIARRIVDQKLKPNFDEAMREALLTMRRTGY